MRLLGVLLIGLTIFFVFRGGEGLGFSGLSGAGNEDAKHAKERVPRRDEVKPVERRSLEALLEVIRLVENSWWKRDAEVQDFDDLRRNEVRSWSLDEAKLLCLSPEGAEWLTVCFERWGREDPEGALGFVLKRRGEYEGEYEELYERDGNTRKSNIAAAKLEQSNLYINAVLAGWAEVDPRAAWRAITREGSEIASSESFFSHYGYLAPIRIFEFLSRRDADFALEEFVKYPKASFRGSMLKGMARGLPNGHDWPGVFEAVLESPRSDDRNIVAVLRGGLLARWMSEDTEKAVEWFRSDAGKVISISAYEVSVGGSRRDAPFATTTVEPETKIVHKPVSLAGAVRHWLVRDLDAASEWLRENQELIPEVLESGSWLDDANVSSQDLRSMLVSTLDQREREEVLRSIMETGALLNVIEYNHEAVWKMQISELQLGDAFSVELLQLEIPASSDPFATGDE